MTYSRAHDIHSVYVYLNVCRILSVCNIGPHFISVHRTSSHHVYILHTYKWMYKRTHTMPHSFNNCFIHIENIFRSFFSSVDGLVRPSVSFLSLFSALVRLVFLFLIIIIIIINYVRTSHRHILTNVTLKIVATRSFMNIQFGTFFACISI